VRDTDACRVFLLERRRRGRLRRATVGLEGPILHLRPLSHCQKLIQKIFGILECGIGRPLRTLALHQSRPRHDRVKKATAASDGEQIRHILEQVAVPQQRVLQPTARTATVTITCPLGQTAAQREQCGSRRRTIRTSLNKVTATQMGPSNPLVAAPWAAYGQYTLRLSLIHTFLALCHILLHQTTKDILPRRVITPRASQMAQQTDPPQMAPSHPDWNSSQTQLSDARWQFLVLILQDQPCILTLRPIAKSL